MTKRPDVEQLLKQRKSVGETPFREGLYLETKYACMDVWAGVGPLCQYILDKEQEDADRWREVARKLFSALERHNTIDQSAWEVIAIEAMGDYQEAKEGHD